MPIGKNSIKRVANAGYSNIDSKAPDMENSVINEPKAEPLKTENSKKATASKSASSTAKKPSAAKKKPAGSSAKKPASSKSASASPTKQANENAEKQDGAIRLGDEMPAYLL